MGKLERMKKLPKSGKKLGTVKEKGRTYHIYNIGGKAKVCVSNKVKKGSNYACFNSNATTGYMLRKLGLEANAGGDLFFPRGFEKASGRKTFRGMNKKQIKEAQKY